MPVVPFEEIEKHYSKNEYKIIIAVGYSQMNRIRKERYVEAKSKGYELANYIHPSVVLHENISIGEGNVILDYVSLQPGVVIGDNNFIWSNAVIAHGCRVENDCWIASGAAIAGDTTIKSGCFIGINAAIGHNITVADETFIGANCLVTQNTKKGSAYISRDTEKYRLDSQTLLKLSGA